MNYDSIEEHLKLANIKVRTYCGPNFWFQYNKLEHRFEAWEQRGPMLQMLFPVDVNGIPLAEITDWEIEHLVKFVRRRRTTQSEREFFQNQEYRKWTDPKTYKPKTVQEDPDKWVDSSAKVENVKRVRVPLQ